jgi:hypothetical protein
MRHRRTPPRELGDREQRRVFALAALLLLATALLLLLTRPAASPQPDASSTAPAAPRVSAPALPANALTRAARVFLAGYLPYIYTGTAARNVRGATRALAASLAAHRPLIPQGIRGAHARILTLHTETGSAEGAVHALVNDGGIVNYTITLRIVRRGGRLLVSELEHQ